MKTTTDLITQRLRLRSPIATDAEAIIAIAGDWDVARRLGRVPHPYTEEHFRFFLEHVVLKEPTWAMTMRENGQVVGVISLIPHGLSRSAELGYYVGRPYWGRGFATEAAQAVVRMGFEVEQYEKLTSRYHVDNPASGHVLSKLGFKSVGQSNHLCVAEAKDKLSIEVELVALELRNCVRLAPQNATRYRLGAFLRNTFFSRC